MFIISICHPSNSVFLSHYFFLYYLKFPPGHEVLHSAQDFYSGPLSMGQPGMKNETELDYKQEIFDQDQLSC